MSRAAGLNSVNCTQCGAGLSVLGGGRILTHVCGYCGAVLDTQDAYKVVASIGERDHPDSPVQIGMTLRIDGAEFTVIGTLGMVETWRGGEARWVEHQIFSETHGYGWLSVEDGNFAFTRKIRDFNMGHWLDSAQVERAEAPPTRQYRGERFRYYETSTARIDFMEGEFNWLPRIGEAATTVVLLGPHAMLGLRDGAQEREAELIRLLPREDVIAQMGLDAPGRAGPHPLAPYTPIREERFLRRALGMSAIAAFLGWLLMGVMSGTLVLDERNISLGDLPQSYRFDATDQSRIARLEIGTDMSNDWATLGLRLDDASGAPLLEGGRTIQYYSGRDGDGAWSEGSRHTTIRFRPDGSGPYTLTLSRLDGTGGQRADVSVHASSPTPIWMLGAAILFAIGYLAVASRRAMHAKNRFAGGDWHEE